MTEFFKAFSCHIKRDPKVAESYPQVSSFQILPGAMHQYVDNIIHSHVPITPLKRELDSTIYSCGVSTLV